MVTRIVLGALLILAAIPSAYAMFAPDTFDDCDAERCYDRLLSSYNTVYKIWSSQNVQLAELNTQLKNSTAYYEAEVYIWQTKYGQLLAQQGDTSVQVEIANLTDRMDAVETKAATNESLIYIIQNMLRTVQTDIEDIFLKINSVR